MVARVNGEEWTRASSRTMMWSFEDIIAHVSRSETLHPGEFLGSGTVEGGCGLELMRFLSPGDVVELEIEGIGTLRNRVVRPEGGTMSASRRSAAVIVGMGHTAFGRLGLGLEALIVQAAREALDDAGIEAGEVDAAWLGHFNSGLVPDGFCSSMILSVDPAMRFKPATRCENACASGAAALYAALDAIDAGRVRIALVVGAEKMTDRDTAAVTDALAGASYQAEERGMSFPGIFARYARAYADAYGDPAEAMAHIAVKNHANAMRNPLAQMHRPLDLAFCRTVSERNPMIADPLKLSDCSLISDGAAALVVVHRDLLPRFRRAVGFRAVAHANDVLPLSAKRLERFEGPRAAFRQAYEGAGVGVGDIGIAEVHDCFTIAELMSIEAMGLAEPGGGRRVVIDGETARDGRLPVNVSRRPEGEGASGGGHRRVDARDGRPPAAGRGGRDAARTGPRPRALLQHGRRCRGQLRVDPGGRPALAARPRDRDGAPPVPTDRTRRPDHQEMKQAHEMRRSLREETKQ